MEATLPISVARAAPFDAQGYGKTSPTAFSADVAQLYEQYSRRLAERVRHSLPPALTGRTEAEDVVQSVFRRFIAHYSRGGYSVPAGQELWKLLLTIAMNKIRDEDAYHRAGRRDVRRTRMVEPDTQARGPAEPDDMHLKLVIEELLAPLSADHQAAVELRLAGHDFAEISAIVGRSKRTIERYLQQFRDRLDATLAPSHF